MQPGQHKALLSRMTVLALQIFFHELKIFHRSKFWRSKLSCKESGCGCERESSANLWGGGGGGGGGLAPGVVWYQSISCRK